MARKGRPTNTEKFIKQNKVMGVGGEPLIIPNHSGDNSAGFVKTPVNDLDIANKKYVDDEIAAIPPTTPAGNNTEIQFNDSGAFGADTTLIWDKTNNFLGVNQANPSAGIHLGPGTDEYSFSANDLIASKIQVKGWSYFDERINSFAPSNKLSMVFAAGIASSPHMYINNKPDDGIHFSLDMTDTRNNGNLIIGSTANWAKNYDHNPASTNPTLIIHSATNPDTDNTQYLSITHDQTNGVITTGKGDLILSPEENVGIGTTTPGQKLEVADTDNIFLKIHADTDNNSANTDAGIIFEIDTNTQKGDIRYDQGLDTFSISYGAKTNYHLNIKSDGKVGIGVTDPDSKLEVNGDTHIDNGDLFFTTDGSGLPYAEIYINDNSTAKTIPTGTSWTKMDGAMTNGSSNSCTADGANAKITTVKAGVYKITARFNGSVDTANVKVEGAIFLDGVKQDNLVCKVDFVAANKTCSSIISGLIDCPASKDIDFRVRHDDGGDVDLTIEDANISVLMVGGT